MREKTRLKILGGSKQHNDPADLKKKKNQLLEWKTAVDIEIQGTT